MPPITVVPMIWRATAPGAAGHPQRHATQNERERSHQNRPQTKPGSFERGIRQRLSFFVFVLGELDDQNRVLCRQADEHHQSDLRVDIALDLHHSKAAGRRRAARGAAKGFRNAPNTATGVLSSTLNGSDQLSYKRRQNQKDEQAAKIRRSPTPAHLPALSAPETTCPNNRNPFRAAWSV